MNVKLVCMFSADTETQKYINKSLIDSSSNSVYKAVFSYDDVKFRLVSAQNTLENISFVIAESFQEALLLKSINVQFICIDEDKNFSSREYTSLTPKIKISGTFIEWMLPEFLFKKVREFVGRSAEIQARLGFRFDFISVEPEDY
ncbi:hypothetical protein MIH18_02805 [Marinobacter sp. M3C]|uniref:hypothetical protein n=1 Tax=Marinobacter sp. M3C TaxID=2917715 RepID=UPI00200C25A7|nr:hypothetical protein [Marinobacter sp. M3C]UQG60901.1 hypothetical protein MIH18_02805 [Marinobacter sp. M3C]